MDKELEAIKFHMSIINQKIDYSELEAMKATVEILENTLSDPKLKEWKISLYIIKYFINRYFNNYPLSKEMEKEINNMYFDDI